MNADPEIQLRLLDLQSLDSAMAQLRHRRGALPQSAEVARYDEELEAAHGVLIEAETELRDLDREQRRFEADIDQVRRRAERDQQRMQLQNAVSPKELENLQHEVGSLARRQSELEDQVLELMERRESAASQLAGMRDTLSKLRTDRDATAASRDKVLAEIEADLAMQQTERNKIASELPADLLALYERIRQSSGGGVGAAPIRHRRCEGCRLELPGSEIASLRAAPPDRVARCENCDRILVRIAESGL